MQAKIFEDAECLRIPEKMDAVEEETTVVVGQDQEKDAIREEEKEMPVGEVTVIKEKKGLFNLWENRKKKEKQERDNYTRSLQLTMTGYAVAEETRPGEVMPVFENETFYYCPDFAKNAVNPEINVTPLRPSEPGGETHPVYV